MSEELNEIEEVSEIDTEEQARIAHENFLKSFPATTVFYDRILEEGNVKRLGAWIKDPFMAERLKMLENHMDESELSWCINPKNNSGSWYLKGHEKPAETREEYIARRETEIVNMVQELIDSTAQQKRYDTGESCCSYVGDPDEEFNADAVAFQAWRGRCWRTCYNILNSVTAGTVPPEDVTDEYVIERLPVMEWPNV